MVHLGDRARRPRRMLASYTIFVATIFASLTACLLSPPAWAQGFPNRPIKIVVGPSPDVFARILGEHLQQAWGQPVIVEPRPCKCGSRRPHAPVRHPHIHAQRGDEARVLRSGEGIRGGLDHWT